MCARSIQRIKQQIYSLSRLIEHCSRRQEDGDGVVSCSTLKGLANYRKLRSRGSVGTGVLHNLEHP
jgi:hypothetical protein